MALQPTKAIAPTIDLIWACRYSHFVYRSDIVPDATYDAMVQEEIEFGGGERLFAEIKATKTWPDHIIALCHYLRDKAIFEKGRKK